MEIYVSLFNQMTPQDQKVYLEMLATHKRAGIRVVNGKPRPAQLKELQSAYDAPVKRVRAAVVKAVGQQGERV